MNALNDAQLQAAYRHCRTLNARHGKTFYLATGLLAPEQRPHIHALYGFARYADDIVDQPAAGTHPVQRLASVQAEVADAFDGRRATSPVVLAMAHTVRQFDIDPVLITDFLASMQSDLTVTRYPTFADLQRYMWGSASVIGLQVLPILGVVGDAQVARTAAADLGTAFQLTNFLRDVAEDYRRGRIYLPGDSLRAAGVTETMFGEREVSEPMRRLLIGEIARARSFYASAWNGVGELAPTARDCVRTAAKLYGAILTEIERMDYQVLCERATVSRRRKVLTGGRGYLGAARARARYRHALKSADSEQPNTTRSAGSW